MSIIFEVTAYDGRMIRLSEVQWRHILFFHPEVEGEQGKIREFMITSYFTERVRKGVVLWRSQIVMSYDREADVVYISFGKPRKAVSEEIDPYVVVRRGPKTKEILGITITNFSKFLTLISLQRHVTQNLCVRACFHA